MAGCSPTRNLKDGQYFLSSYKIKSDTKFIDKDEYASFIRQKPNKKFFFMFRLQMGLYQLGTRGRDSSKFRKWLRNIGEEPIILDTSLTHRSTRQLGILMNKKGYFNALVKDTIIYNKKKAEVIYTIKSDVPYIIRNIGYASADTAVFRMLQEQKDNSVLHPDDNYDEDLLDKERDRFTEVMKKAGYYFFTKQFISFKADTALGTHEVNLVMNVSRLNENSFSSSGISLTENHHKYQLRNIYIRTDYDPRAADTILMDTVIHRNYFFLSARVNPEKRYRKNVILRSVYIASGDTFNISNAKYTYARLTDLNVFRFVNMKFEAVPLDDSQQNYLLDVHILLTPLPNQDFTIETEGTYNAGNLGVVGNLVYRNKNTFKGAEQLEVKLKGGLEFQKTFSENENKTALIFNTFEIGPEINLNLKKLLLLNKLFKQAERVWIPRSKISMSLNYQERPDYNRSITNLLFSEMLKTTLPHKFTFDWFDINIVNVALSNSFANKLALINDKGLTNSYRNHLITTGRLSWLYSNREDLSERNFNFVQAYFEFSGNMLWLVSRIKGNPLNFETDSLGKTIGGISFSQGVKVELDGRHYQNFAENNTLVYRGDIGIGIPYGNSISLPFEKSFYGGGSNDIRAWQFRTLGPGSYNNSVDIEQTGDIKIEGNLELRSILIKRVEGAVFIDAGNIWLRNDDPQRLGATIEGKTLSELLSEVAVGGGVGIRFNFTYFILRLDGAVKLRDPARMSSERWVYGNQKFSAKDINYNIGIGYPF
ncbi:MAG: BamA/TamA family outer membrane protein [Bacteroidia bacterium]|nr:BamA/TamA family outer membrane protein [Bacteroidia bacterium]